MRGARVSDRLSVMTGGDDVDVIEAIELSMRRHGRQLLDAVSFQVRPGQVTGLLGLPGSGKTTLLRRMLQLDPGGGRTLYNGRPFRALPYPMRSVGAVLDPLALHPGRTVSGHLRLALSADPGAAPGGRRERIAAVLDVCGLTDQARTRIAELTEGMTARLAIAQALLGDPEVLLLDEPDRGLEPEGQAWLTALLRAYATQGRCALVSGESTDALVARADRLLVLDGGRLVGQRTARQVVRDLSGDCVTVRTPQVLRLAAVLVAAGAEPTQLDGACLEVRGLDRARIGDLAFRSEIPLHELSVRSSAQDPVIAVLQACRRPPAVLPVQTPPAVRVPEHASARVTMPFETGTTPAASHQAPPAQLPQLPQSAQPAQAAPLAPPAQPAPPQSAPTSLVAQAEHGARAARAARAAQAVLAMSGEAPPGLDRNDRTNVRVLSTLVPAPHTPAGHDSAAVHAPEGFDNSSAQPVRSSVDPDASSADAAADRLDFDAPRAGRAADVAESRAAEPEAASTPSTTPTTPTTSPKAASAGQESLR